MFPHVIRLLFPPHIIEKTTIGWGKGQKDKMHTYKGYIIYIYMKGWRCGLLSDIYFNFTSRININNHNFIKQNEKCDYPNARYEYYDVF